MTIDAVLVDTDVVSFLLKDDTRAQAYRPLLTRKTLVLSFMTVAELYQWAYRRNWSEKRLAWLEERLRAFVIAPYDNESAANGPSFALNVSVWGSPSRFKMPGLLPRLFATMSPLPHTTDKILPGLRG